MQLEELKCTVAKAKATSGIDLLIRYSVFICVKGINVIDDGVLKSVIFFSSFKKKCNIVFSGFNYAICHFGYLES